MNLNEYQQKAMSTCTETSNNIWYMLPGLTGEVGEINSLYAKSIRKNVQLDKEQMKLEIGDVLWFVSGLCSVYGFTLQEIAQINLEKLKKRQTENKIIDHA